MRDKVTRQCPQTTTESERRAEANLNRGPSAYQPNALPLGQTSSPPEGRSCVTRSNPTHKNTVVMVMHTYTKYNTIISAVMCRCRCQVCDVGGHSISGNVTGACLYTRLCVPESKEKTTAMCTKIIIQARRWVLANIKSFI